MSEHRSGFVAVIGKPNVGKSTLVNFYVGQKVSIVSDKAQTTRRRMLGISSKADHQIVFVDTPGIHRAKHKLGQALNDTARQSLDGVDLLLIMVDASRMPAKEDEELSKMLHERGLLGEGARTPLVLCLNKMDRLKPDSVERVYEAFLRLFPTEDWIMTSFTRLDNVDKLEQMLLKHLPEGPPLFPEDQVTDQSMRFLAAELVREKVLHKTRAEVPHAVAALVTQWEDEGRLARISVDIIVESSGQKGILIGKGGSMLKTIGTEARTELQEILGGKVFLELFVKVRENWRGSPRMLKELDYL